MRLRVLLVDDNRAFLEAAESFLSLQPELQVVGALTSGYEALVQIPLRRPDLILMDWKMPGMSGLETMQRLKFYSNAPRVVLLTLYDESLYRIVAQSSGADGLVSKSDWLDKLMPLIYKLFEQGIHTPGRDP